MKCNATAEPLIQEISIEQIFNLDLPLTNEKDGAVFAHKFKGDLVAMTTSLIVAKYFDKEHKNVIRAIKDLDCSDDFRRLNFQPSYYQNEQNKRQPMYRMTRDGFMFLVMGFTGKKAAKFKERFISLFNKMHSWINQRVKLSSNQHLLNDAIQFVELQRGEKDEHSHARENTLIYMIALGSSKKKWLRVNGYAPDDDIRAHLSESQLELLDLLTSENAVMFKLGLSYRERESRLKDTALFFWAKQQRKAA